MPAVQAGGPGSAHTALAGGMNTERMVRGEFAGSVRGMKDLRLP